MKNYIKNSLRLLCVFSILFSCSMDPELPDVDLAEINTINNLRQFQDGAYQTMVDYRYMGRNQIVAGEVRADNVFANGQTQRFVSWSKMDINPTNGDTEGLFSRINATSANPNLIINANLDNLQGTFDEADKKHILGEAYITRAMAHFDLLRNFGQQYLSNGKGLGVAYVTKFNDREVDVRNVPRATVEENKIQLYSDLQDGIKFLKEGASSKYSADKVRITLDAAYALQSRIAVYFKDYNMVLNISNELEAIINKYPVTPAEDVVDYWKMSSPGSASIFELHLDNGVSHKDNSINNIYRGQSYADIQAFDNILQDVGFEPNDIRASTDMIHTVNIYEAPGKWRNMGKYPSMLSDIGSDNIKVFRVEEVILNYAEALLEGDNNPVKSKDYLNMIPSHRNASLYSDATVDNILAERRKEFIFEGFRFYDLVRFGKEIRDIQPSTSNNHGVVPAGDNRIAMPYPQQELDSNRATEQNPGY
ncbi:RagB/SusD family nutrient uptake outer membrane protein [Gelidibacter sp.]|uniref:RagB/SusD family nutrient uptake outer membrane protein n=1 Tax=Gelidibacter sp. TaxID=2018083 RepID=UPI002C22CC30|nr:RagB/SusD family nutrient uptake outer membrane protein [Gelidibacter sp.]HUH27508.1 RagB/SusD family nutrient uptake outer membrane protein [Gelidibacter sp.]